MRWKCYDSNSWSARKRIGKDCILGIEVSDINRSGRSGAASAKLSRAQEVRSDAKSFIVVLATTRGDGKGIRTGYCTSQPIR